MHSSSWHACKEHSPMFTLDATTSCTTCYNSPWSEHIYTNWRERWFRDDPVCRQVCHFLDLQFPCSLRCHTLMNDKRMQWAYLQPPRIQHSGQFLPLYVSTDETLGHGSVLLKCGNVVDRWGNQRVLFVLCKVSWDETSTNSQKVVLVHYRIDFFKCIKFCICLSSFFKVFQCLFVCILLNSSYYDSFGLCEFLDTWCFTETFPSLFSICLWFEGSDDRNELGYDSVQYGSAGISLKMLKA